MRKSTEMWAIVGPHGLYIGTWPFRRKAIADHVRLFFGREQLDVGAAWRKCKRMGDKAVKVKIFYDK